MAELIVRAITLHQPWATLIADGCKDIENRTWKPPASLMAQPWLLAIHAGKFMDDDAFISVGCRFGDANVQRALGRAERERSAIIAVCRVVGVVTADPSPWFAGPFGWQLRDVVRLAVPIPCAGSLGLWGPRPGFGTIAAEWRRAQIERGT